MSRFQAYKSLCSLLQERVPKIVVHRAEEIFPALKEIMDSFDSQIDEPGLHSEACPSWSEDGDQAVNIKAEEFSDIEDGEDPVPVTVVGIKAEHENSLDSQKDVPGSHSVAYASSSLDGVQAVNIKVEEFSDVEDRKDPLPMTVVGVKAEHEDSLDSQRDVPGLHSEACASSSLDGVQGVNIKVEEFSDIEDREDPVPKTVLGIKSEHEDCAHSQEDVPGSCTETCPVSSHDANQTIDIKVEEVSDVEEEENPEIKGIVNEDQLIHGEYQFSCDVCFKTFTRSRGLKRHQRIHAAGRSLFCDVCNKSFTRYGHLKEHQRIHSGERPYSCRVCNKSFSQQNHLTGHERIHSGVRPYSCDVCSRSFSRQYYFKMHQRIHSGERPFSCDVCNKSYICNSDLKIHQRMHSGERPFSCTVCNKSYTSNSQLKAHQRMHSGEQLFSCPLCNKSYRSNSELKIHERVHSGERPFSCDMCKKSFRRRSHLKTHQKVQSGGRPFFCNMCNKSFTGRGCIKEHQRMHNEEQPFLCSICSKTFIYKTVLKKHMRICSRSQPLSSDLCKELNTQHSREDAGGHTVK